MAMIRERFILALLIIVVLIIDFRLLHIYLFNKMTKLNVYKSFCKAIGNYLIC